MNGEDNSKTALDFSILLVANHDRSVEIIRSGLTNHDLPEVSLEVVDNGREALQALNGSASDAMILLVDLDASGPEFLSEVSTLPGARQRRVFIFASPEDDYDTASPVEGNIAGFLHPPERTDDFSTLTQMLRYHSETKRPTPPRDRLSDPQNANAGCDSSGLPPRALHCPATPLLGESIPR